MSQVDLVLDKILPKSGPTILFVHGRGNEPKKSLKGGLFVQGLAVHKLETDYGANVIMFNWDSKRGNGLKDRSRPLSKMEDAANSFSVVLQGIRSYVNKNRCPRRLHL